MWVRAVGLGFGLGALPCGGLGVQARGCSGCTWGKSKWQGRGPSGPGWLGMPEVDGGSGDAEEGGCQKHGNEEAVRGEGEGGVVQSDPFGVRGTW